MITRIAPPAQPGTEVADTRTVRLNRRKVLEMTAAATAISIPATGPSRSAGFADDTATGMAASLRSMLPTERELNPDAALIRVCGEYHKACAIEAEAWNQPGDDPPGALEAAAAARLLLEQIADSSATTLAGLRAKAFAYDAGDESEIIECMGAGVDLLFSIVNDLQAMK